MVRLFERAYHLLQRIVKASKAFFKIKKIFGTKVAVSTFKDSIIPPGKSEKYISTIQEYVDNELKSVIDTYNTNPPEHNTEPKSTADVDADKLPIWCCWWQGEDNMPEIVKMCNARLR